MAKVYSRSQGKLIDIPEPQVASPMTSTTGGITPDTDNLKKLFLGLMISQPKQITNLKAIYDFLKPPEAEKPTASEKQAKAEFSQIPTILKELQRKKYLAKGRIMGPISGLLGSLGLSPETTSYQSYRKAVATPLARVLYGEKGTLTNQDIQRALGLLPDISDTPQEAQYKLTYVTNLARNKAKALGSQALGVSLIDPDTGNIYEYESEDDPDYKADLNRGFTPQ